jgi:hypothetical protein
MLVNGFLYPEDTPFFPPEAQDILFELDVNLLTEKGKRTKRYLILSRMHIYLFKHKFFSNRLLPAIDFPWSALSKIKCKEPTELQFKYGDPPVKLNFQGDMVPIFTVCHRFILRTVLPQDRPRLMPPKHYEAPRSKPSVSDYLTLKIRRDGKTISLSQKFALDRFLKKVGAGPRHEGSKADPNVELCHTFRLNQIGLLMEYLHYFVRAFVWIPAITELIVPCECDYPAPGLTGLLKSFLADARAIQKVTFRGRVPEDFHTFLEAFLDREHGKIAVVRFEAADLSLAQIKALGRWVKRGELVELHLPKSIAPRLASAVIGQLTGNPGAAKLTHLTLDSTATLEFGKLLPLIPAVTHLSVERCECEVADIFKSFASLENCSLCEINISANKCIQVLGSDLTVPRSLHRILANDIFWSSEMSLEHFFHAVSSHECDGDLQLEIRDVKGLAQDAWTRFFKTLRKGHDLAFQTIVWDNNPVSVRFFELLERCPKLAVLSVTGCFDADSRDLVQACARFLSGNRTVTHFACAGNDRRVLGLVCSQLIVASFWTNQTVKAFDLRGNAAGPKLLVALAELLTTNRVIQAVHIEDNQIADVRHYTRFFQALANAGNKVDVAWPEKEITMMVQYGTATPEDKEKLRSLWERVQRTK